MTRALHHLALGARDVERVARFYERAFGLVERARHEDELGELRSIWLDVGGVILMIERTREPARAHVVGVDAGPFLLAFRIDEEQREDFEERLESLGASIESRTVYTSYARDPEGHRVAVSFYPTGVDD